MDSSVSPKDEIWFLLVYDHVSDAVYIQLTIVRRYLIEKLIVAEYFDKFSVFKSSPPAYFSSALFTVYLLHCHLLIVDTVMLSKTHPQLCVESESAKTPIVLCFWFVRLLVSGNLMLIGPCIILIFE